MIRFWRWLTCGHGLHEWRLHAGIDLASNVVAVARHCPRCGLTVILE